MTFVLGRILPHLLAWALIMSLAPEAGATTVALKPAADTSLFELNPANNLGRSTLVSGTIRLSKKSRALMLFDLGAIPVGATVTSVTLTLKVVKVPQGGGANSTFGLHRVLQAWGEGTKSGNTGAAAGANEASWNARLAPGTLWGLAGGLAGTDFSSTPSGLKLVGGLGSYTFDTGAGLIADVQAWLRDPAQNFGWMLISQSEGTIKTARRFGHREDALNAATLTVGYTVETPAQQPRLTPPQVIGDKIQFGFRAEANRTYTVEFTTSLPAAIWPTFKVIPASIVDTDVTVSDTIVPGQRYYRVKTP